MIRCFLILLFAALPCFLVPATAAQESAASSARPAFAVFGGAGPGSLRGPTLGLGAEVSTRYGLFIGQALHATETLSLFRSKQPVLRNTSLGVLYGWRVALPLRIEASLAAGIARTTLIRRGAYIPPPDFYSEGYYESSRRQTVGFPVALRLQIRDDRGWGGAFVRFSANVNRIESYRDTILGLFFEL